MGFPIDAATLRQLDVTSEGEMRLEKSHVHKELKETGVLEAKEGTVIAGLASQNKFTLVKDHFKNPGNFAADIARLTGNHIKIINAGNQKYYVYLEKQNGEFLQTPAASRLANKLIIVQPGGDEIINLDLKTSLSSYEDDKQAKLVECKNESTPNIAKCEGKVAKAFKYQKPAELAAEKVQQCRENIKTRIQENNLEAKDVKNLLKAESNFLRMELRHYAAVRLISAVRFFRLRFCKNILTKKLKDKQASPEKKHLYLFCQGSNYGAGGRCDESESKYIYSISVIPACDPLQQQW